MRGALARVTLLAALLAGTAGCAGENPSFAVHYAPGFVNDGAAVSVFGVFRDGRLAPEAWDALRPRLSPPLRGECEAVISPPLRSANPALFATLDARTREDGITDDLLDAFGSAAEGEWLLVIEITGSAQPVPGQTTTTSAKIRNRAGHRLGARHSHHHHHSPPALEITASLFSKRRHESVATLSMTSRGTTEPEAFQAFAAKLTTTFPLPCAGWTPAHLPTAPTIDEPR